MAVSHVGAREAERKCRDLHQWPVVSYAQRYVTARQGVGQTQVYHLSDHGVMATAFADLVARLGVTEFVASSGAKDIVIVDTDEQEPVQSKMDYVSPWWRDRRIDWYPAWGFPSEQEAELQALFREAGVRRGFYGGIVATGKDCPRVALLLADYGYGLQEDVWIRCEDRSLAFLVCHELDFHAYSPDPAQLDECTRLLADSGVRPYPGGFPIDEEWIRQGVVAYGGRVFELVHWRGEHATKAAQRERPQHLARAAREADDADPLRRAFAAYLLGLLGGEQHLVGALRALHDTAPVVRSAAAEGLGDRTESEVPRALERVVREDSEPDVRTDAVMALGSIATPATLPLLLNVAESHPAGETREAAVRALLTWSRERTSGRPRPAAARRLARVLLEDSSHEVRSEAAEAVAEFGGRAAVPMLAEAFDREPHPWVRGLILSAIEGFGDPRALPVLARALRDPNRDVRADAVDALSAISHPRARSLLRRALKDGDAKVRERARQALGQP